MNIYYHINSEGLVTKYSRYSFILLLRLTPQHGAEVLHIPKKDQLLSQPNSNTKRSWGDHIIEWNPPHHHHHHTNF